MATSLHTNLGWFCSPESADEHSLVGAAEERGQFSILVVSPSPELCDQVSNWVGGLKDCRIEVEGISDPELGLVRLSAGDISLCMVDVSFGSNGAYSFVNGARNRGPMPPFVVVCDRQDDGRDCCDTSVIDVMVRARMNVDMLARCIRYIRHGATIREELVKSEQRYALAALGTNDGIWDWDLVADRLSTSLRFCELLGLNSTVSPGRSDGWIDRVHVVDRTRVREYLREHLDGNDEQYLDEYRVVDDDDEEERWMLVRGAIVRDENGRAIRMAGSLTEVTARKLVERQLSERALHDSLTGLANRVLFTQHLYRVITQYRSQGPCYAVLLIDLDRFRLINDGYGHQMGDKLLVQAAHRISLPLSGNDIVARVGGAGFAVLLERIRDVAQIESRVRRILTRFVDPFDIDGEKFFCDVSIGVAVGNASYQRPEDLICDADAAMHCAKLDSTTRMVIFEPEMRKNAQYTLWLDAELRAGLDDDQFELHYQPVMEILSEGERLVGFEALLRWNHPDRKISPAEFIPVAEKSGLILSIGEFVIDRAVHQAACWNHGRAAADPIFVNVNVSAVQLRPELCSVVQSALERHQCEASWIHLEVTETALVEDTEQACEVLTECGKLGLEIHLDDFGTGHSTLTSLVRYPLHALKIDMSFISRMLVDPQTDDVVRAVISLGRSLNMKVIAEGVSEPEILAHLRALGCPFAQGYLLGRPMPVAEAAEILAKVGASRSRAA